MTPPSPNNDKHYYIKNAYTPIYIYIHTHIHTHTITVHQQINKPHKITIKGSHFFLFYPFIIIKITSIAIRLFFND